MSSNSVCNHTRDKQIGLPLRGRPILLSLTEYDYRPNWTPLSPITITYFGVNIRTSGPQKSEQMLYSSRKYSCNHDPREGHWKFLRRRLGSLQFPDGDGGVVPNHKTFSEREMFLYCTFYFTPLFHPWALILKHSRVKIFSHILNY